MPSVLEATGRPAGRAQPLPAVTPGSPSRVRTCSVPPIPARPPRRDGGAQARAACLSLAQAFSPSPPHPLGSGSPSQHPLPCLFRLSSCVLSPARVWADVQGIRGISSASGGQAAPVASFVLRQGRHRLSVCLWDAAGPWDSGNYTPVLLLLLPDPSHSAATPRPQHSHTLRVNPEGLMVEKREDGVRVCRRGLCGLK